MLKTVFPNVRQIVMTNKGWRLRAQQFILPKSCSELAECEDAIGINLARSRFAVADGATEAFDARNWARLLAHEWVDDKGETLAIEGFRAWIAVQGEKLHTAWHERALSWYAEEKRRAGSYAAFVGVQFELNVNPPCWKAIALGDACLIQLRNAAIEKAFPLTNDEEFSSSPVLVPSLATMQDGALLKMSFVAGTVENEDVFLLLSDAAAAWYLRQAKNRDALCSEVNDLLAASRQEELAALFQRERRAHRIKDDDIAVLRIEAVYA